MQFQQLSMFAPNLKGLKDNVTAVIEGMILIIECLHMRI